MDAIESGERPHWVLAVGRATLFPADAFDPVSIDHWSALTGGATLLADQVKRVPPPPQRLQTGPHLDGLLSIQFSPGRIDILLSGDPAHSTGRWPFISNVTNSVSSLGRVATRATSLFGLRQGRLAFAVQLLAIKESVADVLTALKEAVPNLPFEADDQEVGFRRARRIPSTVRNYSINYVTSWNSVQVQMMPVFGLPIPPVGTIGLSGHALQWEVEANTDQLASPEVLADAEATMQELVGFVLSEIEGAGVG